MNRLWETQENPLTEIAWETLDTHKKVVGFPHLTVGGSFYTLNNDKSAVGTTPGKLWNCSGGRPKHSKVTQ